MRRPQPEERRPARNALWMIAACLGCAGIAGVLLAAGCTHGGGPVTASPAGQASAKGSSTRSPGELVIWSVSGDRNGIAVALNDLRVAQHRAIGITRSDTKEETDLHAIVRDLIDDKHVLPMYPFSLTISDTYQNPRNDPGAPTLRFKFARDGSLSGAWRPLYECAGDEHARLDEGFARKYPDPAKATSKDQKPPPGGNAKAENSLSAPKWLGDLDWRNELRADLEASNENHKVVIVGPGSSDEVPALWFLLRILARETKIPDSKIPPMISTSATWSALKDAASVEMRDPKSATSSSPWVITLSRALGLSADNYHFRFARQEDIDAMKRATYAARTIAPWFIRYARGDDTLVAEIHHQLVGVRGYRRIAILYRDSLAEGAGEGAGAQKDAKVRLPSPELARRLYGPALSDEFRKWNGKIWNNLYFDSPFPLAPARLDNPQTYEKKFADWELKTGRTLKPILRFFEREQVEAVGVFGNSADERSAVLKIVRKEIPNVQLFTAEPDWRLESPDPPGGEIIPISAPARPQTSAYPLNGLMVFASSIPDRDWVSVRFQELNELAFLVGDGEAFLPNVSDYYTAHVVKRLIDLALEGNYTLLQAIKLKPADDHPAGTTRRSQAYICAKETDQSGPCSLECFLRERSEVGTAEIRHMERSASGIGDSVLMLISNGRLRPINEPGWADGRLGVV
ncbi:MAG TPA: hypothetical protein VGY53_06125, partial [Isosphaeraceae bacterium]|nr:hypothetical protein [Isosphaeraceae bacterium]